MQNHDSARIWKNDDNFCKWVMGWVSISKIVYVNVHLMPKTFLFWLWMWSSSREKIYKDCSLKYVKIKDGLEDCVISMRKKIMKFHLICLS